MNEGTNKKLIAKELSMLCNQFYSILKAGIPFDDGVLIMSENMGDKNLKVITKALYKDLVMGENLSVALRNVGVFPKYMVNMIEIGEKSGRLDEVCQSLGNYYERENVLRNNIKSAITYPIILILMITAVMAVLVIQVIPVLEDVIADLSGDITASSSAAVNIGVAVGRYAFITILVILALAFITFLISKTAGGNRFLVNLFTKVPAINKINNKIGGARFASVLSMLLDSGYNTEQSLELLAGILPSEATAKKALDCKDKVANGELFEDALEETKLFTGLYPSMIKIAVKTGTLDLVMGNIATSCNDDARESLDSAVSLIEPIIIGVLSVVIGIVLISNLLPLLAVISSI